MASPFTPGYDYGEYLSSIPNLQRLEDVVPGATQPGGLESFTDGTYVYNVSRQQYEDGTVNTAFPVAITKRRLADLIRKDGGGLAGPTEGSFGQVLNPDGTVQSEGLFHPTRDSEELKKWGTGILAAAALIMGGAAAAGQAGGTTAGGAAVGGAAEGAGAVGAAEGVGAAGTASGGAAMGANGAFLGEGAASGIGAWDAAAGSGVGFGGGAAGAGAGTMAGQSGLGTSVIPEGSAFTPASVADVAGMTGGGSGSGFGLPGAGGGGSAGGSASGGTPPPSNPYNPGSYFNADNLKNLAGSTMSNGSWTDFIGPALSLFGGKMSADAAKDASAAQLQAAREAMALNEPFRQFGIRSGNRLMDYLGASGNTGAEGYNLLNKDFTAADFQTDPGYQFRQQEGERALQRAASAQGGFGSGKFLKDAMRFNQGQASQEFGNAFNRFQVNRTNRVNPLLSIMGAGQTSANTIGEFATQAGNAQAAGKVGAANAYTNAIGQGVSMYNNNRQQNQNNALMQYLMQRG